MTIIIFFESFNTTFIFLRGELKKSGIYDKWSRATNRRIQYVGEPEQEYMKPLFKNVHFENDELLDETFASSSDAAIALNVLEKNQGILVSY